MKNKTTQPDLPFKPLKIQRLMVFDNGRPTNDYYYRVVEEHTNQLVKDKIGSYIDAHVLVFRRTKQVLNIRDVETMRSN